MLKFLLNILAPKKCQSCNKEGHFLCDNCYEQIQNFEKICYVCQKTSKDFSVCEDCKKEIFYDKIMVLKHYRDRNFSKIIKQAKFYGKKEIFEELSYKLYDLFLEHQKVRKLDDFIIVSIPSFFSRKWKRGYNSSEVLASYFSKQSKIPYDRKIVKKVKNTIQQSKLSREKRLTNLSKSFIIRKNRKYKWYGKNVVLIDDVVSTGTTLNEVAKILKQEGVKQVIGLVLASD